MQLNLTFLAHLQLHDVVGFLLHSSTNKWRAHEPENFGTELYPSHEAGATSRQRRARQKYSEQSFPVEILLQNLKNPERVHNKV